jgi:hypothetical protein
MPWSELERHFAQGNVIYVSEELDLIDVAVRVSHDDKDSIARWMAEGKIGKVSDLQAQGHESTASKEPVFALEEFAIGTLAYPQDTAAPACSEHAVRAAGSRIVQCEQHRTQGTGRWTVQLFEQPNRNAGHARFGINRRKRFADGKAAFHWPRVRSHL